MGSQSSRLVNGQDQGVTSSGALRNQYSNLSGNSMVHMNNNDLQGGQRNFINTVFQWTFGGNKVQLTGTFTNWVDPIPLKKLENNCFEIILKLSPGVYQYKYIVDGEWRFSPDDPTCNDENGNINNIIDTTNIERSLSLIGQNANNSARFLAMSSQNNSINFLHRGLNNQLSASHIDSGTLFNGHNRPIQMQLQHSQQQQMLPQSQHSQLQQQMIQQSQQQQGFHNFQDVINQQNIQMWQQLHMNAQSHQQHQMMQQQQPHAHAYVQSQFSQMYQQPQTVAQQGGLGVSGGLYQQLQYLDKAQLMIKAQILQQSQTNFDEAFKEKAPQIPPHLADVSSIRKRNAQSISINRQKDQGPKQLLDQENNKSETNLNKMVEEEQGQILPENHKPEQKALKDAEVLIHMFQPSHYLSTVDHVALNHVGVDNQQRNEDYNVYCTTLRFKTKYTTYKFYTSKYETQILI